MGSVSLWLAIVACLLGCLCSASSFALRNFNRKRVAEMFEQRGKIDRYDDFIERLPRILLVATVVRTVLGIVVILSTLYYVETNFTEWSMRFQYFVASLTSGIALIIFAGAIPASWARYAQEKLVLYSIPIYSAMSYVLWFLIAPLAIFDPIVRRISGVDIEPTDHEEKLTNDLLSVMEEHQSHQEVGEEQKEMLEAIVEFPSTTVDEIMTPRTDVEGIESQMTLEQIKAFILKAGHSRYPVYGENLDEIAGILYAKDLLRFIQSDEPFDIHQTIRKPMMVPESKPVRDLLEEFKAEKVHIAIVVDEYGGTAGLVTVEDIIEEIVGEIHDEYEPHEEAPTIHRLDEYSAEVDARVHIDELDDELGVPMPDDPDYDTVGGFVFATLGHIPTTGERFIYEDFAFTVTDTERTRVKRVLVEQITRDNQKAGGQPASNNGARPSKKPTA